MTTTRELLTVKLERPRGNAINLAFLDAAASWLDRAEQDDVGAVVLTGRGRTFCAGLDLAETLDRDREEIRAFVDGFERFFERVFRLDKPVVAAVNGHAIAGGCILAMACDVRLMVDGDGLIGINEVALGIPFPSAAFEIARAALTPAAYADCFLEGRRLNATDAHRIGLLHETTSTEELMPRATARAKRLASSPLAAYGRIKADLRRDACARIRAHHVERREAFLDAWFSPEGRERRQALVASLKK